MVALLLFRVLPGHIKLWYGQVTIDEDGQNRIAQRQSADRRGLLRALACKRQHQQ